MIPINFINMYSEEDRKKIVAEFYALIIDNRNQSKRDTINNWCETNLNIDGKTYTFKDVVIAEYDDLVKIKTHIDKSNPSIDSLISGKGNYMYIKEELYKNMPPEAKKLLLDKLEVTVCPYCNRNFINSSETRRTCHFDHFFNKNKYPILSVSFYNLIPVCPACNTIKGQEEFTYSPHNQNHCTDKLLKFSYELNHIGSDDDINTIKITIDKLDPIINSNIDTLKLESLYQIHRDIVLELKKKAKIFNKSYFETTPFPELFKSDKEFMQLLIGNYLEPDEYGKRPLTKLMRDISIEENLLEVPPIKEKT